MGVKATILLSIKQICNHVITLTKITESACESITIIGDDESEAIHTGYTIRAELVKKQVEVQKETEGSESVFEKRVFVTMAQRTYTETKLASVAQESIDTQMAVAELAEMLVGGAE